MKEIYLDNSATTQVFPEVARLMSKIYEEDYGNPSSMHSKGIIAERYIKDAKDNLSKILKVNAKEILFTSCGTESDNMALIGCAHANARKGKHLITTKIEHPAILNAMKQLEEEGFKVTYLGTDNKGIISLDELRNSIKEDTILVSIMHVNNEIGSVQPIKEAGELIKEINKDIIFHVDAVQSFGKFIIHPKKMNIDLLSVSGHKIHGPKGIGFLYINEKIKIKPIIFGGGQQNGLRSGTENVAGIAGMSKAASMLYDNLANDVKNLYEIKKYFIDKVSSIEDVFVNGIPNNSECEEDMTKILGAPHVISVSVKDIRSEVMLHALEESGVFVSAGSACSTHKRVPSATLSAIGLDPKLIESTIRFSLSVHTTKEDIDFAIEKMNEYIPMLRKYIRR